MIVNPLSNFVEVAAVSAWMRHLGGLSQLEGYSREGRSEFVRAASEPLPPAAPLPMPRVLAHEEAPSYLTRVPEELQRIFWWTFAHRGETCILAQDLDLLSALAFFTRADTEREYAIERDASGRYLILSGVADGLIASGDILLHTHQDDIALPSKADLAKLEWGASSLGHADWSMIYSTPPNEHQLAFIQRILPHSFEIFFWRDQVDRERDERRTSVRNFSVRAFPGEVSEGTEYNIVSLEVRERTLEGRIAGEWTNGREICPDRDAQEFWKGVLEG